MNRLERGASMRRALLFVLLVGAASCQGVPLLAPAGSAIFLTANPTFISINGGVSTITGLVTRPDGVTVSDGTVVNFFTDLGHIDSEGKTGDGIVRVNLVSDGHSGTAHVQAFSGGPSSTGSTTSASSTLATGSRAIFGVATTTTTTTTIVVTTVPSTTPVTTPGNGTTEGNPIQVLIGNVNAATVLLAPSGPKLVQGRPLTMVASVFDSAGNPLANVPVFFTISPPTSTEFLDSSGTTPEFTDTNGQAMDTLHTKQPPGSAETAITVVATVPSGPQGTATVLVN
jgi:hypothetical protein